MDVRTTHDHTPGERWVVVGGGATGSWIALEGAKAGHEVVLVDADQSLGGLTATQTLDVDGTPVEVDRFYHVILESDRRVLALLDELGLAGTVRWTAAPAEIVSKATRYPATSLVQMANLPMLKFADRARIGLSIAASLALPMRLADRMTSVDWLRRVAGRSALDAFWGPILRAKLGTQADQVSATFMVSTFRRLVQARLKGAGDKFGVLPQGYRPVFDALMARIAEHGGRVVTGHRVVRVENVGQTTADGATEAPVRVRLDDGTVLDGDRVFVTAPGPIAREILPQLRPDEAEALTAAPNLGVVCGTFLLETPPNDCYITYLVDDVGLTGVIGMHALLGTEATNGAHLVYLPHYCAADDEWFEASDEELATRLLDGMRSCFPDQDFVVKAQAVNKARHVVPLPLPRAGRPLAHTTSIAGVHVVSAAQNTTGTLNVEGSLEMAATALAEVLDAGNDTTGESK